jgi:hypothetical protein
MQPRRNCEKLRQKSRRFLAEELTDRTAHERALSWIGITWPKRYVVLEEVLAAGEPVTAHWIANCQSGPLLLHTHPSASSRR